MWSANCQKGIWKGFFFLMWLLVSEQILVFSSINPDLWCNFHAPGVTNGFLTLSAHEFSLGYNDLNCLQNMSCAKSHSQVEGMGLWVETHQRHQPTRPWKEATQMFSRMRLFRITTEPETSIFINFDKATQRDVRQVG